MYRPTLFIVSLMPILLLVNVFNAPASADPVEQILAATGVHGGLVVHVGCGDGRLIAAFGERDGFLVQGLERSEDQVNIARTYVQRLSDYGKVSISQWQGPRLPYIDNLVNLLLVEGPIQPAEEEMLRVLAPQGVAYLREGFQWKTLVKARPSGMDDWTHYMYDATGNAVSHDTLVAPPAHLQWVGSPRWGRHHDHMASTSGMVSAGGRVFYIFDEGSTSSIMLPSRWHLIARDAFNGVVLWKRPIQRWYTRFAPLKGGPAQLPRRLVATSEHVYVTLGLHAPVCQLDGTTGQTLQTYADTENTWEIVLSDSLLYTVLGSPRTAEEQEDKRLYSDKARAPGNPFNKRWQGWDRTLRVVDPQSGQSCWQLETKILPGTLAVDADNVYFHNSKRIVAVDKQTGRERWVSQPVAAIDIDLGIPTGYMPSLVVNNGVIVFAGGHGYKQHMKGEALKMVGLSARDGTRLWEAPHYPSGYQSPEDLLVINEQVLSPFSTWLKDKDPKNNLVVATDLFTGQHVQDFQPNVEDPVWFIHHRCYPSKATTNYLLMSKEGIEFVDLTTQDWTINHWIRGECLYGIMPANGLVYASMHECACSADMKLNGFNAVAAPRARVTTEIDVKKHRLFKGPAYGKVKDAAPVMPGDWPTFRHDSVRSGVASCSAPSASEKQWETALDGKLCAPVVAGGQLYVASQDRHTLYALNEQTGKLVWTFCAEGRIDSPPTIYRAMALFGSRDGCVYCLRAADGALVWRFRAVAKDHRLMAWEQVESVWPVHGSILIRKGEAWFVAGRSAFLDGGLQMYRLQPETGKVLSHATFTGDTLDGRVLTGAEEKRLVGLPDILSASEDGVFMRAGVFTLEGDRIQRKLLPPNKVVRYSKAGKPKPSDMATEARAHLFSSYGFLDDTWFHRSYWVYSPFCTHRHGYAGTGRRSPAGRILVCDDRNVYGFGRQKKYFNWTTPMEYRLFAEPKEASRAPTKGSQEQQATGSALWEVNVPVLVRGLVLAGDTLFAAGVPDVLDETRPDMRTENPEVLRAIQEQEAALAGQRGGILLAVSKKDGKLRHRSEMEAPPVFDGVIAANGRLYLALQNGTVQCWK